LFLRKEGRKDRKKESMKEKKKKKERKTERKTDRQIGRVTKQRLGSLSFVLPVSDGIECMQMKVDLRVPRVFLNQVP
jgi:hypothetical protein